MGKKIRETTPVVIETEYDNGVSSKVGEGREVK